MKCLGIDIGGTNIDVVAFDKNFIHLATYPTAIYITNLEKLIKQIISDMDIESVGIGAAVWIKEGNIIYAPHLPSQIEISKEINGIPIFLDNDANCFALFAHELLHFPNVLAITIGTGIGSGICINGAIYNGNGIAGEIGHWVIGSKERCKCGGFGHLECFFSGWALKKKYGKEAKELMKNGYIYTTKEFDIFCRAIANAITLIDPSAVVFGGRIGMNLDEEMVKKGIHAYLMPPFDPEIKILRDDFAGAKGACLMAIKKFK